MSVQLNSTRTKSQAHLVLNKVRKVNKHEIWLKNCKFESTEKWIENIATAIVAKVYLFFSMLQHKAHCWDDWDPFR